MTTKSAFNEDKVALLLGCIIFILGLGKFAGLDLLGWVVKIGMWVDSPVDAWKPATKGMMAGWQSLLATYVFVTGLLAIGVKLMKGNVGRFVGSFTVIFFIAIACYTAGANAYIAANPTQLAKQGIPWALGLSTEAGLIAALVMGILISNFAPSVADSLRDACRPELFVKIAIVVLGAELGVKAADAAGFAGQACAPLLKLTCCTGPWFTTLPVSTSSSTRNGPLLWLPVSPSAVCPPLSPLVAPSAPGRWSRSWFLPWSLCSPALKC